MLRNAGNKSSIRKQKVVTYKQYSGWLVWVVVSATDVCLRSVLSCQATGVQCLMWLPVCGSFLLCWYTCSLPGVMWCGCALLYCIVTYWFQFVNTSIVYQETIDFSLRQSLVCSLFNAFFWVFCVLVCVCVSTCAHVTQDCVHICTQHLGRKGGLLDGKNPFSIAVGISWQILLSQCCNQSPLFGYQALWLNW